MKWKISTLQNGNLFLFAKGNWLKKITHNFESSPCSNVANCSCSFCFTFCTYDVKVIFFSKLVLQGPKSWHEIFVSLSILTLTPDLMFNCSCSWPVPKYRLFNFRSIWALHFSFSLKVNNFILFCNALYAGFFCCQRIKILRRCSSYSGNEGFSDDSNKAISKKATNKGIISRCLQGAVASLFARVGGREGKC